MRGYSLILYVWDLLDLSFVHTARDWWLREFPRVSIFLCMFVVGCSWRKSFESFRLVSNSAGIPFRSPAVFPMRQVKIHPQRATASTVPAPQRTQRPGVLSVRGGWMVAMSEFSETFRSFRPHWIARNQLQIAWWIHGTIMDDYGRSCV